MNERMNTKYKLYCTDLNTDVNRWCQSIQRFPSSLVLPCLSVIKLISKAEHLT